jgi:hypothetical protein
MRLGKGMRNEEWRSEEFNVAKPADAATGLRRVAHSLFGAMASSLFSPGDVVRVARLEEDDRDVDSSVDPPPQPRVGNTGRVIEEVADGIYLVERCTDDGRPLWLAEFLERELELIERP